ncbi:hypothetical protein [uncultured Sphingomonas sp.]|uniref:hypothetical protein n=1 Tax=uncultured Sphingomonas sp. TaxID=158754 RepID=UPI0035C99812
MDLRADVEMGRLTLLEASELSRLLSEKWGVGPSDMNQPDWPEDFLLPLMREAAKGLVPADRHLADLRATLSQAIAA